MMIDAEAIKKISIKPGETLAVVLPFKIGTVESGNLAEKMGAILGCRVMVFPLGTSLNVISPAGGDKP